MAEFLFGPSPNEEAREFLRTKPAVSREVFDGLAPEAKARAFVITGIEDANLLQGVRDQIADLAGGGDWDAIKREVAESLTPWLGDSAERRAEVLLRTHGYQAYAAAQKQVIDRQRDVFPYLMYQAAGDGRVRDSHAALDGKVLPADSDFWKTHFPPWEYGCRCQAVPLMREDVEDIEAEDAGKPPEARRVIDGHRLRDIEAGTLHTVGEGNMPRRVDVRAPTEKFGGSGFSSSPGSLRMPADDLRMKYDGQVWRELEERLREEPFGDGRSTYQWMAGEDPPPLPDPEPAPDALLTARDMPVEEAANILRRHPDHPVTQAVRAWGEDEERFKELMRGDSAEAVQWRETMTRVLWSLAPAGPAPLYRGMSFPNAAVRDEMMKQWHEAGEFAPWSVGMSTSLDPAVAMREQFLNKTGVLIEIRNNRSGRYLRPLFEAAGGAVKPDEDEVVVPGGTALRLLERRWRTVVLAGERVRIPYIIMEEK